MGLLVVLISTVLVSIAALNLNVTGSSYYLMDSFEGQAFFDNFQFQTDDDPTHGNI
jgi:hypothetical protein